MNILGCYENVSEEQFIEVIVGCHKWVTILTQV